MTQFDQQVAAAEQWFASPRFATHFPLRERTECDLNSQLWDTVGDT